MSENKTDFVYFRKKLGVSFKIHGGKVLVVGNGSNSPAKHISAENSGTNDTIPSIHGKNDVSVPISPRRWSETAVKALAATNSTSRRKSENYHSQPNCTQKSIDTTLKKDYDDSFSPAVFVGANSTYGERAFVGSSGLSKDSGTILTAIQISAKSGASLVCLY